MPRDPLGVLGGGWGDPWGSSGGGLGVPGVGEGPGDHFWEERQPTQRSFDP